jgi:hypothetical protein
MKTLLLLLLAAGAYGQTKEPKDLKAEEENALLKLQSKFKDLEKPLALIQYQMQLLSEQWAAEEARLREKHKIPAACKLTPDRKWKCEEPKDK